MLRLSKLADYAVVVMTAVARGGRPSAGDIARDTGVSFPTVAKLTGELTRGGLLVSHRGVAGGFALARPASAISLADIVEAIDGPISLTHCADGGAECTLHGHCSVKPHWEPVNQAVRTALSQVTLTQLSPSPVSPAELMPA